MARTHCVIEGIIAILLLLALVSGCSSIPPAAEVQGTNAGHDAAQTIPLAEEVRERGFILGVGDEVSITVWNHDDLNRVVRINPSGKLFYPLVGEVEAAGLSTDDLRRVIADGLHDYIRDPQVNVDISSFRSRKVYVLGEVERPGILVIEDTMNIMDALLLAGGLTLDANQKKIVLIREHPDQIELRSINVKSLLNKGDMTQMVALQRGDVVFAPPSSLEKVARFFDRINRIISPVVDVERSILLGDEIEKIISGEDEGRVFVTR